MVRSRDSRQRVHQTLGTAVCSDLLAILSLRAVTPSLLLYQGPASSVEPGGQVSEVMTSPRVLRTSQIGARPASCTGLPGATPSPVRSSATCADRLHRLGAPGRRSPCGWSSLRPGCLPEVSLGVWLSVWSGGQETSFVNAALPAQPAVCPPRRLRSVPAGRVPQTPSLSGPSGGRRGFPGCSCLLPAPSGVAHSEGPRDTAATLPHVCTSAAPRDDT